MILRTPIFSTLLGGRRPRVPAHFPSGFGRAPGSRALRADSLPKPADRACGPVPAPPGCRLTDEMPGKPGFQFRGIF